MGDHGKKEENKRKNRTPVTTVNKIFDHNYSDGKGVSMLDSDPDFSPLPDSPSNSPAPKKSCGSEAQPSLHSILNAINDRAEEVKADIKDIKTSIEFMYGEIEELKKENCMLKYKNEKIEAQMEELKERVADAERYKRRWCLRLYGLSEKENENVKEKIIDICHKIAPDLGPKANEGIDIVHRLGKRIDGKTRVVIILFAYRSVRDIIWRSAKDNSYLRENKLRFGEDLSKEDKDARSALWPVIEQARKNGKRAYFVGRKAYVDGREIRCASDQ